MKKKNPHAVALGRRGGSVSSPKKTVAARENAKLGGRPKKKIPADDEEWVAEKSLGQVNFYDQVRRRNGLRQRLWSDDAYAHRWLCHRGDECSEDGCQEPPDPRRAEFYRSEPE